MSFHLGELNRRTFLGGMLAAIAVGRGSAAAIEGDDRWALLSDTHIAADRTRVNRDVNLTDNLNRVIDQVLSSQVRPSQLFISGDLALGKGEPGDYATLLELLEPVAKAKLPIHLMLGNHDHRMNFRKALGDKLRTPRPLEEKHVAVVESPHANWFMLDSLEFVNATPGNLGDDQLRWLTTALDAKKDKPAIIVVHHNPVFMTQGNIAGLKDTDKLFELLAARHHVKAVFFGHTHHWDRSTHEGIHLINLPPVAYLFMAGDPNGWVEGLLKDNGMTLTMHTLDKAHSSNGQITQLDWRPDRI